MVLACSDTEEHILNKIIGVLAVDQVVEYIPVPSISVLTFRSLEIRLREKAVYLNHVYVAMSYHEFHTLSYLAQHPGWVFSKEQIYEAVWKESGDRCGTAVVNVISQIRRKIGEGYIKTVINSGYKFEA